MKYIKRFFKKNYLRFILTFKKIENNSNNKLTESQKMAMAICRRLIHLDESKLLIAPISGKKYIKNEPLDIFVTIDGTDVNIINHNYSYIIHLSERQSDKLHLIYNLETEKRRTNYEKEINSQIEHSLHTIFEKIS